MDDDDDDVDPLASRPARPCLILVLRAVSGLYISFSACAPCHIGSVSQLSPAPACPSFAAPEAVAGWLVDRLAHGDLLAARDALGAATTTLPGPKRRGWGGGRWGGEVWCVCRCEADCVGKVA